MNGQRILVPVDLEQGRYEGLEFVAGLENETAVSATLLYVVELNVVSFERRIYDELCREKEVKLRALATYFFGNQSPHISVRIGRPPQEILAEAAAQQAELIVMASPRRLRKRWPFRATTVERVVRAAPCLTLVLPPEWKVTQERYRQAMRPGHFETLEAVPS